MSTHVPSHDVRPFVQALAEPPAPAIPPAPPALELLAFTAVVGAPPPEPEVLSVSAFPLHASTRHEPTTAALPLQRVNVIACVYTNFNFLDFFSENFGGHRTAVCFLSCHSGHRHA